MINQRTNYGDLWKNETNDKVWIHLKHYHYLGKFENMIDALGLIDTQCSEECLEFANE